MILRQKKVKKPASQEENCNWRKILLLLTKLLGEEIPEKNVR